MDTTNIIKGLAKWYALSIFIAIFAGITLDSQLPEALQEFQESPEYLDINGYLGAFFILVALIHLVAIFQLITEKVWGKNLFIYSTISLVIISTFLGPMISSGLSYMFESISTTISGMIIALLWFTPSLFSPKPVKLDTSTP